MTADRPGLAGSLRPTRIGAGPMLPAMFVNLRSRRVISRAVSNRVKRDVAIRVLKKAIALRARPKG